MGMYDNLKDVIRLFRYDETLLRLLYYPAEDLLKNSPDPLDTSLPNLLDMEFEHDEELWKIRDKRILSTSKSDDLEKDPICRLYVFAGRRTPDRNTYVMANQELAVEVFCHSEFEKDLRSLRISDRINELLLDERITGIGRIEYVNGFPINAPNDYVAYRHIYKFGSTKS